MKLRDRKLVTPEVTPETKPYWDAAARQELTLRRCKACGQAHHYPRTNCPFCFSDQTVWETASGNGVIYSFSIMRQGEGTYVIAYVKLAEGPTMMTNLVDCDTDQIAVGKTVRVVFKAADGAAQLPMFTLLDE